MWKRRTREENEVLWGVCGAAVHSRLVLIIRVLSDTPALILCGLWLRIFVNSHLWFVASQKKGKKRVLLSFFLYTFSLCVCVTNSVPLYSSIWKSVNHIYSSNGGFVAVNDMPSALTLLFFKWRKHFFGSMNLVEVCSREYKFTSDLSLCVFGILYIGSFLFLREDFGASGLHMTLSPHCPTYTSNGLGVKTQLCHCPMCRFPMLHHPGLRHRMEYVWELISF